MNPDDFAARIRTAKDRLPILDVLERLNIAVVRRGADRFCACPVHHEKTESCRVGGNHPSPFKCFGCGAAGDQIHFIESACGLNRADAIRHFLRMAGFADDDTSAPPVAVREKPPAPAERKSRPTLPELNGGTMDDRRALAALRGVSVDAVLAMVKAGMLFFCDLERAGRCWLITDLDRINAQARRLDGKPIFGVKSHTLAGSWAKWPVGISTAGEEILFVEGGPDMLAAFEVKVRDCPLWSPVGMFGGGFEMLPAALPLFARKNVTIVPHNDGGKGDASAGVWSAQLAPVAGSVRLARIPGAAKDLNDYVRQPKRIKLLP
jgi:hypothetical protein